VGDRERLFAVEITDLHRFFEQWFRGEGERTIEEFTDRLDDAFTIVDPTGHSHTKQQIAHLVESRRGGYDVTITTSDAHLNIDTAVMVGTYREHHRFKNESTSRLATVVMAADSDTPTGFRWLSVHETWIDESD